MANRVKADRDQKQVSSGRAGLPARWWIWCLVFAGLAAAAGLHVRERLLVVQLGYALSEAADQNRRLQAEHRKLSVEVATLRNPRRLRALAVERLRLAEPAAGQILQAGRQAPKELALGQ